MVILSEAPVAPTSSPARIVVGSEDGPIVALSVSRLPSFLVKHHDAFFLSPNRVPLETAMAQYADTSDWRQFLFPLATVTSPL